jgi:LuxR family maltose regulon positive regulatory protein
VEQLLSTKLFIPPTRLKLVSRPRLVERIDQGLHGKLTLISAPAGFGKTTLVSEWVEQTRLNDKTEHKIAWVSLDDSDNDPVRFLNYITAALRQLKGTDTDLGEQAQGMLNSPQPPTNAILTSLINDIAAISEKIILILDDYHLVPSSPANNVLTFLLENLPPNLHLVIVTREDPQLPLARLRASSKLNELRAADLRFTTIEAVEFLNQVMGLALSSEDIKTLETRTEGWIAGLQLAAITMQGREDTTSLIESFSGSHRLVLDYLIEEILEQQSESIQNFLLKTAVLDRLTGSLCDALTGMENSQDTLEELEHTNLFIIPLDEERHWYRYHHLFADLLLQRLNQTQPDQILVLHHSASEWYEKEGIIDKAIDHSLRSGDFIRAVELLQDHVDTLWARGEHVNLRRWLNKLPSELVLSTPQIRTDTPGRRAST